MSRKLRVVRDHTPEVDHVVDQLMVSKNEKTGVSINASIARSCRPTRACASYCYGLEGRLRFPAALAAQARNSAFFETATEAQLIEEAKRVGRKVLRSQDFVRMFGVGDLQPGSARFVTHLAALNPTLQVWVSTRKLELAQTLPVLKNLHVMMSCDSTTTPANIDRTRDLARERGPQFFPAWVRHEASEPIPDWVSVVFEEHHLGTGRAPWDAEARSCPATVRGGDSHDGACARCRRCFDTDRRRP